MKQRILFVDDEPNILDGLRRMLRPERGRWQMDFAENADVASARIREFDYDAIVSDVDMPGRDGFALLAEIQGADRTRDIPVIILTGRSESDTKRRALDLGATDLLNKPVNSLDLIARLSSAIRLKSYQTELRLHNEMLEQRVRERTAELENSRLDIIWRLGKAAERRDEETGNHVIRVGCCCRVIAEQLAQDADFVEMLFLASPLHDIGKIGIPDAILLKCGPLSADQWTVMKQHCSIGAGILSENAKTEVAWQRWRGSSTRATNEVCRNPVLKMASSIAMNHHERWDGTGYPAGLAGQEIPLAARITAIVDVYDALRSERPYKDALCLTETMAIIRRDVGRHFDPEVHRAFEACIDELEMIRTSLVDEIPELVEAGDQP